MREAMRSGWNSSRASDFSPVPTNRIGLTGDLAYRQRGTAARIAIRLGENDARETQGIVERLGGVDRILARHAVDDEKALVRLDRRLEFSDLAHHFRIDMQPAGGIEEQHVVGLQGRFRQRALGDGDRRLTRIRGREAGAHLRCQGLQLQYRRRPINVGADHQHFFVLLLDQPTRQFARAGGLACALQAGEHHDHRPLGAQVEAGARRAHEPRQFLMHDLDERLAGSQALGHLHAHRARFDGLGEALDHGQRHVGIEQREADLAHRLGYVVFGESAAAGQRLQRCAQAGG